MIKYYSLYNIQAEKFWALIGSPVDRNRPFHSHLCEWEGGNVFYLYPRELNNNSLFNLGANGNVHDPVEGWVLVPITNGSMLPDFSRAFPLSDVFEGDMFV